MQTLPSPSSAEPSEAPVSAAPSTGQAVARATAGISLLHLLRFIVGFVAQPLIAHNLGLSWQAEAYAVGTDVLQRFWLIFEKVINPAFLPSFIGALKEEGEDRAWRFASTAVWIVSLALAVTTPLAWLAMPVLIAWLSRGARPEQIELTVQVARFLLLGLGFLGLSSLTYTILNGYKRFFYAALGDALWKVGLALGAGIAYRLHGHEITKLVKMGAAKMGPGGAALHPVEMARLLELGQKSLWLIAIGFVAGAIAKLLPHVWAIGPKWRFLKFRLDLSDPLVRKMGALSIPLLLGIIVSESRGFYLVHLSHDPTIQTKAGWAALKLSRIVGDNLIQIFPYALSIGIFPFLADSARNRDRQPLTDTLLGALRICVFVFVPLTAILIALRFPLLRAVWESGRLTQADTVVMSAPFVAFTLGLVAFACEMMLSQTYYAMTRAWTPTLIGLGTSVLWIVVAKTGVEGLGWGLAAIAGAESLSKTVKCVAMWILLKPQLGEVKGRDNAIFALKVVALSVIAALVASFVVRFVAPGDEASHFKLKMLLAVTISGLAASGAFVILASALNIEETRHLGAAWGKISRKLGR